MNSSTYTRLALCAALLILSTTVSTAQINVVASTPDLAEFVKAVGGSKVTVETIVRGPQNPHFIDVKPSYMMKLRSADLFVVVGMHLELWAQQIVDGSRNAHLRQIDCSRRIPRLEVPAGSMDASQGDVHPLGNPHYWLDPGNVPVILSEIVEGLAAVVPAERPYFQANADAYAASLNQAATRWLQMAASLRGKKIVTYHSSFSYFARFLGLQVAAYIEPKPGIPPTPTHIRSLVAAMKREGIRVIGLEQYYEENSPQSVAEATGGSVVRLSTSVGGLPGTDTYQQLMEYNIGALVRAFGRSEH